MNRLLNLKGWQEAKMPWAHASVQSSAHPQGFAGANISLFPSSVCWAQQPLYRAPKGVLSLLPPVPVLQNWEAVGSTGVLTAVIPPKNNI